MPCQHANHQLNLFDPTFDHHEHVGFIGVNERPVSIRPCALERGGAIAQERDASTSIAGVDQGYWIARLARPRLDARPTLEFGPASADKDAEHAEKPRSA